MSLFYDLSYRNQLSATDLKARLTAEEAQREVVRLQARCDKALLVCEALWTMLRDKLGLTEQELLERVKQIDLTDGALDGRVRKPPVACTQCGRETPTRIAHCIYCGAAVKSDPFNA